QGIIVRQRSIESSSTMDGSLAAAAHLRGLRVLIVEDSWHMAIAVQSLLEGVGMGIAGAAARTTDAERLASVNARRVAGVDRKLQDGMAFDLIDRLHDLGIRIVVISGFATFSNPLGKATAILRKPFEGAELLDALVLACC